MAQVLTSTSVADMRVSGHTKFELVEYNRDHRIVFIRDLDQGDMSITNNAEEIYRHIRTHYGAVRVVYQDTLGQWDEIAIAAGGNPGDWQVVFLPWNGLAWDILNKVKV